MFARIIRLILGIVGSRRPIVLLYHSIPSQTSGKKLDVNAFERQMRILNQWFDVVDYHSWNTKRSWFERPKIVITFDDGYENNFTNAFPVLNKYEFPAIIFCSTIQLDGDYILWFNYVRAVEEYFRINQIDSISEKIDEITNLVVEYVHNMTYIENYNKLPYIQEIQSIPGFRDKYASMSFEQLKVISKRGIKLGLHTHSHPYLTMLDEFAIRNELCNNLILLSMASEADIDALAYPIGDYNSNTIIISQSLGVRFGFAVDARVGFDSEYEIERIGIYSTSIIKFVIKCIFGNLIRDHKFKVG